MRKRRITIHENYDKYRPMIAEAFKNLRKKGLLARMNFSCCGSCGSYELSEILEKNNKNIGYVFWHRQSEESFKSSGSVYLYYSCKKDCDKTSIDVANLIVEELNNNNIPYVWDGNVSTAIFVGSNNNGQ